MILLNIHSVYAFTCPEPITEIMYADVYIRYVKTLCKRVYEFTACQTRISIYTCEVCVYVSVTTLWTLKTISLKEVWGTRTQSEIA